MTRPFSPAVFAFAAAVIASVGSAQTPSSIKDSPFLPPAGATPAAAANDSLTFTGVSGTGDKATVCIFDTKAKRSYWIPVGSTTEGIKILSFDSARDQVALTVGGEQKTLALRSTPVASGTTPGPAFAAAVAVPAATPATPTTLPAVTQGTPQPPPVPGSIAHQETEARMLVSDLLEIGMQQRKAYEEAQKKAEAEKEKKKKS